MEDAAAGPQKAPRPSAEGLAGTLWFLRPEKSGVKSFDFLAELSGFWELLVSILAERKPPVSGETTGRVFLDLKEENFYVR
jgi:hypothetical protein